MTIRKNDIVKVMTGDDKGKTGKVLEVLPKENKAVVEGVNIMKRRQRARRKDQKGQVVEVTAPIHISNLKLASEDKKTSKK
jgi:large subunit ribosomal protein L24